MKSSYILYSKARLISNSSSLIRYNYTFRRTPIQFHSRTKSIPSCVRPIGSRVFCRRLTTNNGSWTNKSTTESQDKPILTELIYGRTRIFTALAPASTHSPTSSKSSPQAPSSPLLWQWEPQKSNSGVPEVRSPVSSFIGSIKQSLSAMFLPVG